MPMGIRPALARWRPYGPVKKAKSQRFYSLQTAEYQAKADHRDVLKLRCPGIPEPHATVWHANRVSLS